MAATTRPASAVLDPPRESLTSPSRNGPPPNNHANAVRMLAPEKHHFNWELFRARLRFWMWEFFCKVCLSILYMNLIADGAAKFAPVFAVKLAKVLPSVLGLQVSNRYTLGHVAASIFLVFVWVAWHMALSIWMPFDTDREADEWRPKWYSDVIASIAVVLMVGDCALFYYSLVQTTWSGTVFSLSALIATAVYAAILMFAVHVSREIGRDCILLSRKANR